MQGRQKRRAEVKSLVTNLVGFDKCLSNAVTVQIPIR
jgi:hypothetical protein